MTKKYSAFSLGVLTLLCTVVLVARGAETLRSDAAVPMSPAPARPNIVVILVDDMGFSDIRCYGGEIPTPHLDALAENGVRFSQFYNTGRCSPTRASLLTGLYPHQAGMGHLDNTIKPGHPGFQGKLASNCVTIPEVLNQAGYFTAMTGKWHLGQLHGTPPWKRGFQRTLNLSHGGVHFSNQTGPKGTARLYLTGTELAKDDARFNPPWYGTDLWTEWGLRFIDDALVAQQPFFLYLSHPAPHFPCMAPEETIARFRGSYRAGWDILREQRYQRQIELGLIDPRWSLTPRPNAIPAWDSLSAERKKRYDDMMAIYAAMIDEVDRSVGTLVRALRQRDQLDNTLILFLSDNGGNAETGVQGKYEGEHPGDPHSNVYIGRCWAHLNNTPFRRYKHYNHEGGIATPLIAHWPDAIKPRSGPEGWVGTPAHLVDIMATCVDVAGATYPDMVEGTPILPPEGTSLLPLLTGTGDLPQRAIFFEHEGNAAIRVGDRKLVRKGKGGTWELFDMKADRTEQQNLADRHPDEVEQLAAQWRTWARRAHVLPIPDQAKRNRTP